MFKVLDVREYISTDSGSISIEGYASSNAVHLSQTLITAVIALDLTKGIRTRFKFFDGYKDIFLGKNHYYGYTGDFALLVPGDTFDIETNNDFYTKVIIK